MTGIQKANVAVTVLTQVCLVLMTTFGATAWKTMDRMENQFGSQLQQVVTAVQGNNMRLERVEERIGEKGLFERVLSDLRETIAELRAEVKRLWERILELEKRR